MEGDTSELVLFFGRFHPLVLHLPIGLLTLAFIQELLSRLSRFKHLEASVSFVLMLGATTAFIACVLGLMLSESGEYEGNLLLVHQWSGIGVFVLSVAALFLKQYARRSGSRSADKIYVASMVAMFAVIAIAGHYGGSLTHGSDYLTRYMPAELRAIAGIPEEEVVERRIITNLDSAIVYTDIIDPIFRTYCTSCHNETKRKGELMMHNPEAISRGGENGKMFVAGNAAGSLLVKRILLPEGHEDHMPPEGKRQLSDEEKDLLTWWINEGASFDKTVSQVNVPAEVRAVLDELVDPAANKSEVEILLSSASKPISEQTLSSLRCKGLNLEPLTNDIHWLQADVAPAAPADSILRTFSVISENLTWLNLAGTGATDDGLAIAGTFRHLTRLHVGNTAITDKGLEHLKNLSYLETLNLYGTQVSDEGIQHLAGMKNLRKLYLWKTHVTPAGAADLQKELPGLVINLGLEVSGK